MASLVSGTQRDSGEKRVASPYLLNFFEEGSGAPNQPRGAANNSTNIMSFAAGYAMFAEC